jgi:hypothetical protein
MVQKQLTPAIPEDGTDIESRLLWDGTVLKFPGLRIQKANKSVDSTR